MTVKELKNILKNVSEDAIVRMEVTDDWEGTTCNDDIIDYINEGSYITFYNEEVHLPEPPKEITYIYDLDSI